MFDALNIFNSFNLYCLKVILWICAPSLAKALHDDFDINVTLCDIDTRFSDLPGFTLFDLNSPFEIPDKTFDMIFFDPPFFSITLEQQARAISTLAKDNFNWKLLLSYPHRGECY